MMAETTNTDVERRLGLWDVMAVVIGGIIGVGIFFTPASIARELPSPAWMLGIWVIGGLIALMGALVLAEMGARVPKSGGVYVFLRRGLGKRYGPPLSFLYAWVNLWVVQPGALAIIAWVLVINLEFLVGPLSEPLHTGAQMAAIALFTVANAMGLKTGSGIQRWVTAGKILAVALMVILGVVWGAQDVAWSESQAVATDNKDGVSGLLSYLIVGLIPVLFSFGGWQHGTFVAGVARDPQRTVPWGIVGGVAVVVVCYVTINIAYLSLLGQTGMAESKALAAEAAQTVLGDSGGLVVAAVIMLSAAGIINTILLAFPYVIFALSRDGLFINALGKLHPKTGTPVGAIVLPGFLGSLAVLLGSDRIDSLLAGVSFGEWAFFALASVAFFGLRRQDTETCTFVIPALASILFGLSALLVAVGALILKPQESATGLVVIIIGIFVYMARSRSDV